MNDPDFLFGMIMNSRWRAEEVMKEWDSCVEHLRGKLCDMPEEDKRELLEKLKCLLNSLRRHSDTMREWECAAKKLIGKVHGDRKCTLDRVLDDSSWHHGQILLGIDHMQRCLKRFGIYD